MHKSINVFESGVTRVGSVISPSRYNSLFSASIFAMTFSNSLNKLGGELGGRYQVRTRNGVLRGLLISTKRHSKRSLSKSLRIQ